MSIIDSFKLTQYKSESAGGPIIKRRIKLIHKIEEQILLASDSDYIPTKAKRVTDEGGKQVKVKYAKRIKRWRACDANGSLP
jgi:hypothetical protein